MRAVSRIGRIGATAVALSVLLPAAVAAQGARSRPPELASLFPSRAPITVEPRARRPAADRSLARLLLPPEVLAACRPDLSDLRVLDRDRREVPFVVDAGRAADEAVEVLERVTPEILGAARSTLPREGAPDLRSESYELAAPPPAPPGEGWELVVETDRSRFVRRIVVTGRGTGEAPEKASAEADGGDKTAEGPSEQQPPGDPAAGETADAGSDGDAEDSPETVAEGSIFRLPAAPSSVERNRERLRLALPEVIPPRLTVTLEGEDASFLEPGFRFERSHRLPGRGRARVPLTPLEVRTTGGRTVLELERPRGLVPDVLVLETATPAFSRRVEVWDEGPGSVEAALGSGTLYRVPAVAPVRDLEVPLLPARGDRLRVVIHDGDSPPLEEPVFRAAVRRPALVFSMAPGGAGPDGELLFGGGRAYRPRYDLAELLPALPVEDGRDGPGGPLSNAAARITEHLIDPGRLAPARLGPIEPNPLHDPSPALAFAHHPGAPVDAGLYRLRRTLRAVPSPEGLARLTLTPEDLAHAQADLADLRIVDPESHQWAYLVEHGGERDLRELPVERSTETPAAGERGRVSRYELALPARPATLDRVILDSPAAFFDRPYSLRAVPHGAEEDAERVLTRGRLRRRVGDPRPVTLAFPEARLDRLVLEIEDGDDAPLTLSRVEGRFPLPRLFFPVPEGSYALLLGNPGAGTPRYELTRARDVVLAVAAESAEAGPLVENPEYRTASRWLTGKGVQRVLLWAALGLAVLVLALLTLRLARRG